MDKINKIVSELLEFQHEENYLISVLIDNSFTCGIMNVVNNKVIYNGNETYKIFNKIDYIYFKDQEDLKCNLLIENIFNKENDNIGKTDLYYNDINIQIAINKNYFDSKKHIYDDYKKLENIGIDTIIKDRFISWLKSEKFKDIDNDKFLNGLKIISIYYDYYKINDTLSPTKKTDFFGVFVFKFVSISDYTKDMLESVCMSIFINNDNIVEVTGYDIC